VLNALELAVLTTEADADGVVHVTREVAEESIQQRAVLYDKEGDAHFDTISAFIKSVRGSDADAALYWLAKMVYAGEDPRFILRRLLILASEDVGLADPGTRRGGCGGAGLRLRGLPEGRYHLAQATLYLATAPKSNSTMGFFDALEVVRAEREAEVPNPCATATATPRVSATGPATPTRTPTANTGWRSSTYRSRCRARSSTSRATRAPSAASATRWRGAVRRSSPPCSNPTHARRWRR
jgi:replication-associated recombination protein RarA